MKKSDVSKYLFYILYVLLVFYFMCGKIVGITEIRNLIYKLLPFGLIFLIFIQDSTYKLNSFVIIGISTIIALLTYIVSNCSDLFLTILFIIASKNIEFDKFLKIDLKIKIILTILLFTLSSLGLTTDVVTYRDGVMRYSLGFGHPNALGAFLFSMCIDIVGLNYKKIKIYHYIFIIVCFFISTFVCDSRGAQFGIIFLMLFNFIFPILEKRKLIQFFIKFLPYLFFIISIILVKLYLSRNAFVFYIDDFISNRIKYAAEFYEYYNITLFGNYFENFGQIKLSSYLTMLDNAYINLLLRFGLVTAIFICLAFSKMIKKAFSSNKCGIAVCLMALFIYGLMENYIFLIVYNPMLLFFSNLIYFKE